MDTVLAILQALEAKGVRFSLEYATPHGHAHTVITAEQAYATLGDPFDVATTALGVTQAEYRLWLETAGFVHCSARTREGKRCRQIVSGGGSIADIHAWVLRERAGELCPLHGGDGAAGI